MQKTPSSLQKKGRLEVVCGSMFSGKTEELMRRLHRAEFAKQNVLTLKPSIDTRKSLSCIVSHNNKEREAIALSNGKESLGMILDLADETISVVGIDEVQFLSKEIVPVILELIERGKRVIVELKNGKQYIGTLKAFDIHINTVLDEAEERENNELRRKIGTIFIRGDTIILISPE